eukprot:jgi/Tetstr1/466033/TSEL_010622.t1
MAVSAPPMSRATSSQHPATTASATADGAVAGGDALPGDDDAPDAPRQEAEEKLGGVDAQVGSIRGGHVGRGHENSHLADARTV